MMMEDDGDEAILSGPFSTRVFYDSFESDIIFVAMPSHIPEVGAYQVGISATLGTVLGLAATAPTQGVKDGYFNRTLSSQASGPVIDSTSDVYRLIVNIDVSNSQVQRTGIRGSSGNFPFDITYQQSTSAITVRNAANTTLYTTNGLGLGLLRIDDYGDYFEVYFNDVLKTTINSAVGKGSHLIGLYAVSYTATGRKCANSCEVLI